MTTPNPSPVAGLIEALNAVAVEQCDCAGVGDGHVCPYVAAHDALAAFRARPRLRDMPAMREAAWANVLEPEAVNAILDALDQALFGDRP